MASLDFKQRHIARLLPKESNREILLLTGARQTGKTTLLRHHYPQLRYLNLDAREDRELINQIPTKAWAKAAGEAIFDEAQKAPTLFEKIKYAFDNQDINFSVLSGSSQILLLKQVRETLAGRIKLLQLYPLTLSEIESNHNNSLRIPLLEQLIQSKNMHQLLSDITPILFSDVEYPIQSAFQHLYRWGGMPKLLDIEENDRNKWLRDYESTYLERDLADLARINDLQPFRLFQKLTALRSAQLLNFSELARDASISVDTARRYIEYLKLSYQVYLLQPYYRNLTSSLIKSPKVYWLDMGIWRSLTGMLEVNSGQSFETLVVSEIIKWVQMMHSNIEPYFYRTQSGLEVDLLLQINNKILGVEVKSTKNISGKDKRGLIEVGKAFKDEWLGGILVYSGNEIKKIAEPNIWAIPAIRLLSTH